MTPLDRMKQVWSGDLRIRLMIGQTAIIITIMVIGCLAAIYYQSHTLQEGVKERALALARTFSAFGAVAVQDNLYQLQESMQALQKDEDLFNLDIVDEDHMISAALHPPRIGTTLPDESQTVVTLNSHAESIYILGDVLGRRTLLIVEPLQFKTGEWMFVRLEYSLARVDQIVQRMIWGMTGMTLLLVLVGIFGVFRGVSRISEVLHTMTKEFNISLQSHNGTQSEVPYGQIEQLSMAIREANRLLVSQQQELRKQADLLERKVEERTSELAEARDRALDASKAKAEFLSTMSHEIRTPMNAIIAMADLLQETPLSPEQQEYVGRFSRAGTSLLDLINAILDISKIESGHLDLESIAFDIHDLVDKTAELMSVRAHAKQLELVAFVHPDVPTWLLGDPARLRQVFVNLVGNAIKFTETGEVVIRVEPDEADPVSLRCSVSDTGIGIPADKIGSIFEDFTQVDSSTTRKYGGTGLGLGISKRLVELMKGHLIVESIEGLGTTFSFVVYLPKTPPPPIASSLLPAPDLRNRRILLVDDTETNRMIVREHLKSFGPVLVEAPDGSAALQALDDAQREGKPFDCAILDYHMPNIDGLNLAQAIRARTDCTSLPLIMHASDMRGQASQRARELGIASYAYKPVSRMRLLESLSVALRQAPAAPAPQMPVPSGPESAGLTPLRILLVEDLEDNRAIVRLFLKDMPYTIEEAENGLIALQKFQAGKYDLVFMDMQMPVMGGLQATVAIRAWEREYHRPPTPIIALTANALKEEIQKSAAAGCIAHLTKPIKKKTLLAAIAQYAKAPSDLAA